MRVTGQAGAVVTRLPTRELIASVFRLRKFWVSWLSHALGSSTGIEPKQKSKSPLSWQD